MKKILLLGFFTINILAFSQNNNLLENGGFESNLNQWDSAFINGSVAEFDISNKIKFTDNKSLRVSVDELGPNSWDVNMVQKFRSKKGVKYKIEFFARSTKSGKIVKAQLQNTTYTGKEFQLTKGWKLYTWETEAKESDLSFALHFLGTGIYYIDDISITKIKKLKNTNSIINSTYNNASKNSVNAISNGGFEDGFADWINIENGGGKASFELNRKSAKEGDISMKVNLLKAGKNSWDVQSIKNINVKKDKKYRVSFYARSVGNKRIKIQVQDNEKEVYLSNSFKSGFEWKKFTWEFTAVSKKMQFAIHHIGRGTVSYDNFIIEQLN